MIRALIIDDETKARRILKTLLEDHCPTIEVIGLADDVPNGVKLINKEEPDLIFLDIEMPGYSGFQLLDFFEEINFNIIFTTAYSEYALKAFEVSAVDYLLKPIQIDQLVRAVSRLEQKLSGKSKEKLEALKENVKEESEFKRIALPVADGLRFARADEILYLKADSSYTHIYLNTAEEILVSKTLKEFEKILINPCFMRVHRSFIVNLNNVKQYVRSEGGHLIMDNGDTVFFSRDKKEELLQAFKQMHHPS